MINDILIVSFIDGTDFFTIREDGTEYQADFLLIDGRTLIKRKDGKQVETFKDGPNDLRFKLFLDSDGFVRRYSLSLSKLNHELISTNKMKERI